MTPWTRAVIGLGATTLGLVASNVYLVRKVREIHKEQEAVLDFMTMMVNYTECGAKAERVTKDAIARAEAKAEEAKARRKATRSMKDDLKTYPDYVVAEEEPEADGEEPDDELMDDRVAEIREEQAQARAKKGL
jgi:hypothetical protein